MESKEIQNFREQWKKELDSGSNKTGQDTSKNQVSDGQENTDNIPANEKEAAELFNKAVYLEDKGEVYNAIKFYKKAIALVPDIEFKVYRHSVNQKREGVPPRTEDLGLPIENETDIDDLVSHFSTMLQSLPFCEPIFEQQAAHISCLPPEMLDKILSWVVSDQLDLQSLDRLSMVCKGFYLLCRDPELWKKACLCTWGINTGTPECYGSWRDMYILRPHLLFNGCYISRTTYFRKGEPGFQDLAYEPYQFVSYYRYMRFFANGHVFMFTTTDEPSSVVGQLKTKETRLQVYEGHYRLMQNNIVTMNFRRACKKISTKGRHRRRDYGTTDVLEAHLKIEMELKSSRHKHHNQLSWLSYHIMSVYCNGHHSSSFVDVHNPNTYPSLTFSKVKSYVKESAAPLP